MLGIPLGPVPHQPRLCTKIEVTGREWGPLVMRHAGPPLPKVSAPGKCPSFPGKTVNPFEVSVWLRGERGRWGRGCIREVVEAKPPFRDMKKPGGKDAKNERVFKGLRSLILTLGDHQLNLSLWTLGSPKFNSKYLRCQLWRRKLLEKQGFKFWTFLPISILVIYSLPVDDH